MTDLTLLTDSSIPAATSDRPEKLCCAAREKAVDLRNQIGDFLGRLCGSARQVADFVGHHRESTAMFTRPRRLDGSIQRQQVGLFRDRGDQDVNLPISLIAESSWSIWFSLCCVMPLSLALPSAMCASITPLR